MGSSIDDFPDELLNGPSTPTAPKKVFSLGDVDDDEEDEVTLAQVDDSPAYDPDAEPEFAEDLPPAPAPAPARKEAAAPTQLGATESLATLDMEALLGELNLQDLASKIVVDSDPALANALLYNRPAGAAASRKAPGSGTKYGAGERVSRSWLESLSQRAFFLAIGYPATVLYSKLNREHSIAALKRLVDGVDRVDSKDRHILTLEALLERRTHTTRMRLPNKPQLAKQIAGLTARHRVSKILDGFDDDQDYNDRYGFSNAATELQAKVDEVSVASGLTPIEGRRFAPKQRAGGNLPLPSRMLGNGKGRQLGELLERPNSNCYKISRGSETAGGLRQLTPLEAMELMNEGAELERRFGSFYMLRRKDTKKPWSTENSEHIPVEQAMMERRGDGN